MAKAILAPCPADADFVQQALAKSRKGIKPLGDIAEALDCPLWVLLIPDMPAAGLQDANRAKLERLVGAYLDRMRGHHRQNPIVQRWNELRGEFFGPIAMAAVVRESISPEKDYERWRVLGDAVQELEKLTARIETLAYETVLGV